LEYTTSRQISNYTKIVVLFDFLYLASHSFIKKCFFGRRWSAFPQTRTIKNILIVFFILLTNISITTLYVTTAEAQTPHLLTKKEVAGYKNSTSLQLSDQTQWVEHAKQRFTIRVLVTSPLSIKNLGIQFTLFSKLTSRDAYDASVANQEAYQSILDTSGVIPFSHLQTRILGKNKFLASISFPISSLNNKANGELVNKLYLGCSRTSCDGVYPLQVNLIARPLDLQLSTFTTHLVYTVFEGGNLPLNIGLIIPMGQTTSISSSGTVKVSQSSMSSVKSLVSLLTAYKKIPLTLNLSPQFVFALSGMKTSLAKNTMSQMRHLIKTKYSMNTLQVLGEPFAHINTTQLASSGLGTQLKAQLSTGISTDAQDLKISTRTSPYLSDSNLSPKALGLLVANKVKRIIVPENNISLSYSSTITSPVWIPSTDKVEKPSGATSSNTTEALLIDPGLTDKFTDYKNDPRLEASTILGEMAQVYFDAPDAIDNRVLIISPIYWGNKYLLKPLLAGLQSSNILRSRTINQIFATVKVGANNTPEITPLTNYASPVSRKTAKKLYKSNNTEYKNLQKGYGYLEDLKSVLGTSSYFATSTESSAFSSILEGESSFISKSARKKYFFAGYQVMRKIEQSLSFSGNQSITLTSLKGKIPVTINSNYQVPINIILSIISNGILVKDSSKTLLVSHLKPTYFNIETRTSGRFIIKVKVFSPKGHILLLSGNYTISSTAISIEAILLTAFALLILLLWWIKSFIKSKRQKQIPSE